MIRILLFILCVVAAALGLAWFADRPEDYAFLAGTAYALSAPRLSRMMGHLDLLSTECLPFALLGTGNLDVVSQNGNTPDSNAFRLRGPVSTPLIGVPSTSTLPFCRRVAVCPDRAVIMLPVVVNVPEDCAVAVDANEAHAGA